MRLVNLVRRVVIGGGIRTWYFTAVVTGHAIDGYHEHIELTINLDHNSISGSPRFSRNDRIQYEVQMMVNKAIRDYVVEHILLVES